jgi:hypothetical protein
MKLFASLKMGWVQWVWRHAPNCAEMSRLSSQALDRKLSLGVRMRMRLHFLVCTWCRRYAKQLRFLHKTAPRLHEQTVESPARGLSPEARERIRKRVRDAKTG